RWRSAGKRPRRAVVADVEHHTKCQPHAIPLCRVSTGEYVGILRINVVGLYQANGEPRLHLVIEAAASAGCKTPHCSVAAIRGDIRRAQKAPEKRRQGTSVVLVLQTCQSVADTGTVIGSVQ